MIGLVFDCSIVKSLLLWHFAVDDLSCFQHLLPSLRNHIIMHYVFVKIYFEAVCRVFCSSNMLYFVIICPILEIPFHLFNFIKVDFRSEVHFETGFCRWSCDHIAWNSLIGFQFMILPIYDFASSEHIASYCTCVVIFIFSQFQPLRAASRSIAFLKLAVKVIFARPQIDYFVQPSLISIRTSKLLLRLVHQGFLLQFYYIWLSQVREEEVLLRLIIVLLLLIRDADMRFNVGCILHSYLIPPVSRLYKCNILF